MTAPTPVLTQGTTFTFNSVVIGGVVSLKGLGSGKATEIDVTTLASAAKEYRQGLQDFGGFTLSVVRSPDDLGQIACQTAKAAQLDETMVIVLPSGTLATATFTCFCTELSTDIDKDGIVMGEIAFRITGAVVWS
jgi:hypothetical protein